MRRGRLIGLTAAVSLIALAYGGYVWWESRKHVATDDAYVEGNIVVISAKVAGHVASIHVDDDRAGERADAPAARGRLRRPARLRSGRDDLGHRDRHPRGHPEAPEPGRKGSAAGRGGADQPDPRGEPGPAAHQRGARRARAGGEPAA